MLSFKSLSVSIASVWRLTKAISRSQYLFISRLFTFYILLFRLSFRGTIRYIVRVFVSEFIDNARSMTDLDIWLQSFTKYLKQTLVFMRTNALRKRFNLCFFFRRFLLTNFSFREEDWALGINSLRFWDFPDIS